MSSQAADRQKVLAELTPRELEVLHLMADGLDTRAIAQRMDIASHTVEGHLRRVIEKLRANFRLEAVIEP